MKQQIEEIPARPRGNEPNTTGAAWQCSFKTLLELIRPMLNLTFEQHDFRLRVRVQNAAQNRVELRIEFEECLWTQIRIATLSVRLSYWLLAPRC